MAKNSGIGWTDHTFNPWWGCIEVSPACDNCYAREWDRRFAGENGHWGKDSDRRFFGDKHWNEPLKWNRAAEAACKPALVFCASMADVFESGRVDLVPHRERLWTLIEKTRWLTWLLLTKRPQNIRKMLPRALVGAKNVWLGTTIESPDYLWRADALSENAEARVRFVSMEPLIAQTPIAPFLTGHHSRSMLGVTLPGGVDWVITGCESGDKARETPTDWYRSLRDECKETKTPFFFKQAPIGAEGVTKGRGSWLKLKAMLIEQPYLDGVQYVEFPERIAA